MRKWVVGVCAALIGLCAWTAIGLGDPAAPPNVYEAFKKFDRNGDGVIDLYEAIEAGLVKKPAAMVKPPDAKGPVTPVPEPAKPAVPGPQWRGPRGPMPGAPVARPEAPTPDAKAAAEARFVASLNPAQRRQYLQLVDPQRRATVEKLLREAAGAPAVERPAPSLRGERAARVGRPAPSVGRGRAPMPQGPMMQRLAPRGGWGRGAWTRPSVGAKREERGRTWRGPSRAPAGPAARPGQWLRGALAAHQRLHGMKPEDRKAWLEKLRCAKPEDRAKMWRGAAGARKPEAPAAPQRPPMAGPMIPFAHLDPEQRRAAFQKLQAMEPEDRQAWMKKLRDAKPEEKAEMLKALVAPPAPSPRVAPRATERPAERRGWTRGEGERGPGRGRGRR